jgi:hypothetical protein
MRCPKCKSNTEVLETIQQAGQTKRRRRCLCPSCLYRFSSYETPEGAQQPTSSEAPLPEWLERVRNRPGVDKEALIAAYNVDRRRKEIAAEQRRRHRQEAGDYDEDPPLTRDELMREIRGY